MAAGYIVAVDALAGLDGHNNPPEPPGRGDLGVMADLPIASGAFSALKPARTPEAFVGYLVRDWQPDYLDRIIVQVSDPDFGTVAGVVERTLTLWNRYRTPRSVTAQATVGAAGVVLVGWPALPFDLLPSAERSWPLQATPEGDPIIAGYLTFTIGGQDLRTVDLSGIRAIVWPFDHDWSTPPEVTRAFADAIADAVSLAEDRHGLGSRALIAARFAALPLSREEASALARTLERTRALPVGLPLWTDAVELTAAAPAGAALLTVEDISTRRFTAEAPFLMLWTAWDRWAVVESADLAATQITLKAGLLAAWPAGTRVLPLRFGRLMFGAEQRLLTDYDRAFPVEFQEVPL